MKDEHSEGFVTPHASRNPVIRVLTRRFRTAVSELVATAGLDRGRVLDVGCGEGFIMRTLRGQYEGMEYFGVDIKPERLNSTRLNNPGVQLVQASATILPFKEDSFDLVMANEILEHVGEPRVALDELQRVSRRFVLCTVPDEPIFSMANVVRGAYWNRAGRTPDHVNFWSRAAFVDFMSSAVKIQKVEKCFPWTLVLGVVR